MEEQPSTSEVFQLFVEQVRDFKPMRETWSFLDQGILRNVSDPPTYDDYLRLCWEFVGRQAQEQARDALIGRSKRATPAVDNKGTPSAPSSPTKAERKAAAAGATSSGPIVGDIVASIAWARELRPPDQEQPPDAEHWV